MPFTGRAYFDRELDAWVGLSGDDDHHSGHICACDVAAPSDGSSPAWKVSKENLFSEVETEKDMGATLLCIGRGKYCLVQCVGVVIEDDDDGDEEERNYYSEKTEDDDDDDKELARPCRFSYRVSTFSLRYDKNGDLTTGGSHRQRVRYYKLPKEASPDCFHNPVAFWM
uniref:Uncharacterized protein n=1 Tax=Leersia perrieri TaxID=77586 RepID=A0A0D9VYY8_9ORYZ